MGGGAGGGRPSPSARAPLPPPRLCLRWEAQKTDFYIRHAIHSTYPRYRPPLDGTPATLTTPMGIPHWAVDPVGGSTAGTRLGSARPPPPAPLRAPARPRRSVRRGRGRGVTRPARGARGGGAGGMGGMRGGAERLREAGNGAWGGRGGRGGRADQLLPRRLQRAGDARPTTRSPASTPAVCPLCGRVQPVRYRAAILMNDGGRFPTAPPPPPLAARTVAPRCFVTPPLRRRPPPPPHEPSRVPGGRVAQGAGVWEWGGGEGEGSSVVLTIMLTDDVPTTRRR